MNARWLLQLEEGDGKTRQRVRERFWQELLSEQPEEGVQAALAAATYAQMGLWRRNESSQIVTPPGLWRQLCDLLAEGAVANEAVWWALLRGLSHPKNWAQKLAWDACCAAAERLEGRLLADRLTRALVTLEVDEHVTPCLLAILREAARHPCVELRAALQPLRSHQKTQHLIWPALAEDFNETQTVVEIATEHLKDLPLPVAPFVTATDLPRPTTTQEPDRCERGGRNRQ